MLLHIIFIYWLQHHYVIEGFPIEDLVLSLSQNQKNKNVRLCLVTVFCFLFSKTCFWEYKEKTNFLYFWNKKYVWLAEIKKIVFEEKNKKY